MSSHKERFCSKIEWRFRAVCEPPFALLAVLAVLCLTAACANGSGLTEVYAFPGTYSASVIQSADGNFYGTTDSGGDYGLGSVFRLTTNGVQTTLFSFNGTDGSTPNPLIQANDGNLYGTTYIGSTNFGGTFFRVTTNGVFTNLVSLTAGTNPETGIIQGNDGNFYGTTTEGVLFVVTPGGMLSTLANLSSLGDYGPNQITQGSDGNFYGTVYAAGNYGAVFQLLTNGAITNLASFKGTNGSNPLAGLVQGSDGTLYGTAYHGGGATGITINTGSGAIFKVTTNGVLTALHFFDNTNGANPKSALAVGADGNFYGTAYNGGSNNLGTVFEVMSNGTFTTLAFFNGTNGGKPVATLVPGLDGNLYGTASTGGVSGNGTLLQVTTNGAVNALLSFGGQSSAIPFANLTPGNDGNFYGTTFGGGANEYGTVFELAASGTVTTLYSFGVTQDTNGNALDGAFPLGSLTQGSDGNFYGTTSSGGTFGAGTIFQLTTNGTLNTLISFTGTNGSDPQGALLQGSDGSFFGTTLGGGTFGRGTFFNITTDSTLVTSVSFNGTNGANPYAGLLQAPNGNFYGTCSLGGGTNTNFVGTVFMVTSNGTLSTVASFNRTNGASPCGGIILGTDGNFYGTTAEGGTNNCGTVFRLTTNGTLTTVATFGNTNGANPCAGLLLGTEGDFYGTTRGGLNSFGTVFRMGTNGHLTTLASFNSANGSNPQTPLLIGGNGSLYGTTLSGGSRRKGNVFQLSIRPTLQSPIQGAGSISMTWDAYPGLNYQLQRSSDLTAGNWTNVGSPVMATNSILSESDSPNSSQSWFYRVALLP